MIADVPIQYVQKWQLKSSNRNSLEKEQRHVPGALPFVVCRQLEKIPEFQALQDAIRADPILSTAQAATGGYYHGRADAIVLQTVEDATQTRGDHYSINFDKAEERLRRIHRSLAATYQEFVARARIVGVYMEVDSIEIAANLRLVRLTDEQLNDRQIPIGVQPRGETPELEPLNHHAEVQCEIRVPKPTDRCDFFLAARDSAREIGEREINAVVDAFRLAKPGFIVAGPVELRSAFGSEGYTFRLNVPNTFRSAMDIGADDVPRLQQAFALLRDVSTSDRVLAAALNRFFIASTRPEPLDRVVDLTIAWEAIVCTQNGSPVKDELRYRFALHGSSLIAHVRVNDGKLGLYKQMQGAYDVRSEIVHGSEKDKIDGKLKKSGFDHATILANFLEEQFRLAVFWLCGLSPQDRPYRKIDGWLELLWRIDGHSEERQYPNQTTGTDSAEASAPSNAGFP